MNTVKVGLFMTVGFLAWFFRDASAVRVQHHPGRWAAWGRSSCFIIAAVVGGTLLTGGYGSAVGTGTGCVHLGMTQQGIVYAGWDPNWFKCVPRCHVAAGRRCEPHGQEAPLPLGRHET